MAPRPDFAAHRDKLLSRLGDDEAVLLFGGPHHLRNGDAEYRYRPDSDVYWLTGWNDPEVAVFLRPGDEPFTLFCQPKDKERETWTGIRPGPAGARETFGASAAHTFDALAEHLPRLFQGVSVLHYAFARDPHHDALVTGAIAKATRAAKRNGLDVPETFHSPRKLLHELRLHKSPDEVAVLQEAARLTGEAHVAAMAAAAPGMYEYELEALIDYLFRKQGGTGPGYATIVAGGANACILHYVTNSAPLLDGELVLIDAGGEHAYYTADITRTFPVGGRFSAVQAEAYEWVLKANVAAIEAARVGSTFNDMHDVAVRILTEGMVAMGLLEGDVDTLIEKETYKRYYMHGTGHWLGLDVHDVGAYGRKGASRALEPGMVCTVEPGLYVPPDDEDAPEALRGLGIRIEDDVLVTEDGPINLTAAVPKTIAEVEAACAASRAT